MVSIVVVMYAVYADVRKSMPKSLRAICVGPCPSAMDGDVLTVDSAESIVAGQYALGLSQSGILELFHGNQRLAYFQNSSVVIGSVYLPITGAENAVYITGSIPEQTQSSGFIAGARFELWHDAGVFSITIGTVNAAGTALQFEVASGKVTILLDPFRIIHGDFEEGDTRLQGSAVYISSKQTVYEEREKCLYLDELNLLLGGGPRVTIVVHGVLSTPFNQRRSDIRATLRPRTSRCTRSIGFNTTRPYVCVPCNACDRAATTITLYFLDSPNMSCLPYGDGTEYQLGTSGNITISCMRDE